jgi:hypothetical protein
MPPQQSDRPLDVFDYRMNFRAHDASADFAAVDNGRM